MVPILTFKHCHRLDRKNNKYWLANLSNLDTSNESESQTLIVHTVGYVLLQNYWTIGYDKCTTKNLHEMHEK